MESTTPPGGLRGWILDRTGLSYLLEFSREQALKPVPKRLSWAYTLGTLALFFFALQFVTGFLLLMRYAPNAEVAYKAVQTIQHRAYFGWLFRQMHSWGASFVVIVLIFHILKVLWFGSYKRPREFTWFVGVLLLALTLGFCFTGYILPWNQLAKWATNVGTNSISKVPVIGSQLNYLVIGGSNVSGETLGRFFAVHVFLLPVIFGVLALIRFKGITPKVTVAEEMALGYDGAPEKTGAEPFFPRQVYREAIACILGFAMLVTISTYFPFELGEPASRITPVGIKPEWYFLPVYQFLKYFDHSLIERIPLVSKLDAEFVGIVVINLAGFLFFLLPLLDRGNQRKIWNRPFFAVLALAALVGVLALGLLGYVSERTFIISGKSYAFPLKGWPPVILEAASPASPPEKPGAMEPIAAPTPQRPDGRPFGGSCGACHEHKSKHEAWAKSIHARQDPPIQCVNCHKGDDTTDEEEPAHLGVLTKKNGAWRAPEGAEIIDICGGCHAGVKDAFSPDHQALSPKRTCYDCHSNHAVEEASVKIFEKGVYKEASDPRTAKFRDLEKIVREWEKERGDILQEIEAAKKFLAEREFPLAVFADREKKASQDDMAIGIATHALDPARVEEAVKTARESLLEVKYTLAGEIVSIENRRYIVYATWGVTLLFVLLLGRGLHRLRREERQERV